MGNLEKVFNALHRILGGKELTYKRNSQERPSWSRGNTPPSDWDMRYAPSRKKKGTVFGRGVGP